LHDD
jgi:hypothetical protein